MFSRLLMEDQILEHDEQATNGINPGFALGQLLKASATAAQATDAGVRERARAKVQSWLQVLQGMADGTLRIGSRLPVAEVPAWVTTEVIHGGFATGRLAGEGPLRPHELRLVTQLAPRLAPPSARAALTRYYLGDEGYCELTRMLDTGHYRLEIPEEGALLAAAWLMRAGDTQAAEQLLAELGPFLGRLRFYPVPAASAFSLEGALHVSTMGEAIEKLQAIEPRPRVQTMRLALGAWLPLYDRIVQLFVDTTEQGWPCRRFPAGWRDQARQVLQEYQRLRQQAPHARRLMRPGGNMAILAAALEGSLAGRLPEGQVVRVRNILAQIEAKRGLPASERCRALRAEQARIADLPDRHELAEATAKRLASFEPDDGLGDPEAWLGPVSAPSVRAAVMRCRNGSLEELVQGGLVPSSERLGALIPALTARAVAAPIEDPAPRRLYGAIYLAFRRRRSVLLLNYEKQVQFEGLPWVQALQRHLTAAMPAHAREVLRLVTRTALTAFPQTLLPNPLVRELSALAAAAGIREPLVEELAADIFMGGFSNKFLEAAQTAGRLLQGSLYERYYGIPYGEILAMRPGGKAAHVAEAFSLKCQQRAHGTERSGASVAWNGQVIEQGQILTTHNLATLVTVLGLRDELAAEDLAKRCFRWAVRMVGRRDGPWKVRLRRAKNAAYAWRQMVFFLSLIAPERQEAFVAWAATRATPIAPEMAGLEAAIAGRVTPLAIDGRVPGDTCFLGWTSHRHWLLGPPSGL